MTNFNTRIIDEFRANGGNVGGFEKMPLLLLHHKGAKTGVDRISPLAYSALDDGWAIFASKGGADTNPAWLHNLIANPETRIEVGTETVDVRARVADGDERTEIWERHKEANPVFAEYEEKTSRPRIPVVVLEAA
jgi:deazaflavin-dependent oxidoreductase (nitroreductase family)